MEDNFEGAVGDRRTIIYTLDFEMKINLYGPLDTGSKIIRDVRGNLYNRMRVSMIRCLHRDNQDYA